MNTHKITSLSTAVIAFVTTIGLMFGLYYNLKFFNTNLIYIIIFELLFIFALFLFISWIRGGIEKWI